MQIDPARRGTMPEFEEAEAFSCPETAVRGWKLKIPGGRPLATPAVADGRIYLGSGFGGYEFYCLDATTGRLIWQYQTNDDGPTAAVVDGGYVVFNTESCELEVLTVEGKSVWKRWLGDPLMSMPALANGRVYMAYPDTRGDGEHYLACFELETGDPCWRTKISGEVITTPVLSGNEVYFTTLDGMLHRCDQDTGALLWHEAARATSSPAVLAGQCYFSQRKEVSTDADPNSAQQTEHCAKRESSKNGKTHVLQETSRKADYLDHSKRLSRSPRYASDELHDAAVGFAALKGSSKMHQAMQNLGHGHVASVWAYQGSKPFLAGGRLYSSMGDTICCVDTTSDAMVWKRNLHDIDEDDELLDSVVTPPALVNDKAFVCTQAGEVFALDAETGGIVWRAVVGEPIQFQPVIASGRVLVPTINGALYCLETGDAGDDGWMMWGASPAHNGLL